MSSIFLLVNFFKINRDSLLKRGPEFDYLTLSFAETAMRFISDEYFLPSIE